MAHPYQSFPPSAFWRSAVADRRPAEIAAMWTPKSIVQRESKIATFGSCFAQHISKAMAQRGYGWLDAEQPHEPLTDEQKRERNYGVFSARTGNIYTASALRQWVDWASGTRKPPDEVWEKNGRFFDPFRPTIEPAGFASAAALAESRNATLKALRDAITQSDYFVFTLGLTEAWINAKGGYTYALCPGTGPAGEFDPAAHLFKNFTYPEILEDMRAVLESLRKLNSRLNVILTVSPVPLTATASGKNVLVATTYSKSVLRAVAGDISDTHSFVDYFPSYEIITGTPFRGRFYEDNLRSVSAPGVGFVMRTFFAAMAPQSETGEVEQTAKPAAAPKGARRSAQTVCDEELLEAFAPRQSQPPVAPDARKLAFIGNSHLASLRRALNEVQFVDPSMDNVFWGFGGRLYFDIGFADGRFVHPDVDRALQMTGGRFESIDPREFDALVFVGSVNPLRQIFARSQAAPKKRADLPVAKALRTFIDRAHVTTLIKAARPYCSRIFLVPAPLPSELSRPSDTTGIDAETADTVVRLVEEMVGELGAVYLPQPPDTVQDHLWTKKEFSIFDDNGHMNGVFGAKVLTDIRERLESPTAPSIQATALA